MGNRHYGISKALVSFLNSVFAPAEFAFTDLIYETVGGELVDE